MALTKVGKEGITGVSNASNATFLTATAAEGVTLAGTLAVTGVHTVGTNAVATSEGGAVTTIVVQGLAKQWVHLVGTSTAGISDSFNTTSITDNGTGDYTVTIANNMGNATYSMSSDASHSSDDAAFIQCVGTRGPTTVTAASCRLITSYRGQGDQQRYDSKIVSLMLQGDLA